MWRDQSTFKASSALRDEEKTFLKEVKRIREILKLEEKVAEGTKLEVKQEEKIALKDGILKELAALVRKLPEETEVLEKNPDVVALLPQGVLREAEKKRQEDVQRKQRRQEREKREASEVSHQTRHDRPVTGLFVSADGGFIFTCSKDKLVLCWDIRGSRKRLEAFRTFAGHEGAVWGIGAPAPKHSLLLSGGADGKVLLWSLDGLERAPAGGSVARPSGAVEQGGIIRVISGCPEELTAGAGGAHFATSSDKFGSTPACVCTWALDGRGRGAAAVVKIEKMPARANAVEWLGGAKVKLITAHENGYLGIWAADSGELMKTLKLHEKPIMDVCVAAQGAVVFTASLDKSAKCVDVTKREMPVLQTWTANRPIEAVAAPDSYVPDGDKKNTVVLAGGTESRDVTTSITNEDEFDCMLFGDDGTQWSAGKGHFGTVHCLKFFPDGRSFASCGEDGCVKVFWNDGSLRSADTEQ